MHLIESMKWRLSEEKEIGRLKPPFNYKNLSEIDVPFSRLVLSQICEGGKKLKERFNAIFDTSAAYNKAIDVGTKLVEGLDFELQPH